MSDFDDLSDILDDDDLFKGVDQDDRLFDTSRYTGTISRLAKTGTSQRKRMGEKFNHYRHLFNQVHVDIASGRRQIIAFEKVENLNRISRKNPIKQGNFYVDKGTMLYVARIYDPETEQEFSTSTNRKHKVHTVYENGTENHIWLLSLISSLYDKERQGRFVTEVTDDIELMGEGQTTGHIYIVSYAGEDKHLLDLPNLYKIGVAKNLEQRLRGTSKQSTYLYAPVRLVKSYEIKNMDAQKVEKFLHHALSDKQVKLSVLGPDDQEINVTEWFVVDLDEIDQSIHRMMAKLLMD